MASRSLSRWLSLTFLAGSGVVAAVLGGSVAIVRSAAARHLYTEADVPEADVPEAPVALVLGAQVRPDGTPSAFLAARLDLAQRLLESGKVRALLVSGDNLAPEYNEPDAMREYLIHRDVPADKIVVDYAGYDTYDSSVRAKMIFGVQRLTVVTQSYHLPRAVATARLVGWRPTAWATSPYAGFPRSGFPAPSAINWPASKRSSIYPPIASRSSVHTRPV